MRHIEKFELGSTGHHAQGSAAVRVGASPLNGRDLLAAFMKGMWIALDALGAWHERARQRRQLMELDDWMLKDIGITRADACREWRKPFWMQ